MSEGELQEDQAGAAVEPATLDRAFPHLVEACAAEVTEALEASGIAAMPTSVVPGTLAHPIRVAFASTLAESVLGTVESWPLAEIAPRLEALAEDDLPWVSMGGRLTNCLEARSLSTWGDLKKSTLVEISNWPRVGRGTVLELLSLTLVAAMAMEEPAPESPEDNEITGRVLEAVQELSAFAANLHPEASVLWALREVVERRDSPSRVRDAVETLDAISCRAAAGATMEAFDLDAITGWAFDQFDERDVGILRKRILAIRKPSTLEELAVDSGITREGIRLAQIRSIEKLVELLDRPQAEPLKIAATEIADQIGAAWPIDDLPERLAALVDNSASEKATKTAHLLAWAAGAYHRQDDWLLRRDAAQLRIQTRGQLEAVATHGILSREEVVADLTRLGIREPVIDRWIRDDSWFRAVGDVVVIWRGDRADKAALVLRLQGAPMTIEEIFDGIDEDISIRALGAALANDDRFKRRGIKRWGLSEWGGDEYTNTLDLISEEIDKHGGTAPLAEIVSGITGRFSDVLESTVRSFANSVTFVRTEDGMIRLRTPSDPYISDGRVELARDSFLVDGHWALRIRVNSEHLRGSGFAIPTAFAVRLGIRPSDRIAFDGPNGALTVGWRTQPQMSSVRQILLDFDAQEGDLLFLRFLPPAKVEARFVPASQLDGASPVEQLLLQVGADPKTRDPIVALGRALGLASPEKASMDELDARLRQKGDAELVAMLPRQSETLSAAMALLGEEEGQTLEKKETLSFDTRTKERNKELEFTCLRTVAGFLNASGGVLLIGVSDTQGATGVEPDLECLGKDLDRYELHLRSLLTGPLGDATVATGVAIRFHEIDGKQVCEVRADPSPDPVYITDKKGNLALYVRSGNQTKALPINEAVKYIERRFGGDRKVEEVLATSPNDDL